MVPDYKGKQLKNKIVFFDASFVVKGKERDRNQKYVLKKSLKLISALYRRLQAYLPKKRGHFAPFSIIFSDSDGQSSFDNAWCPLS